MTRSSPLPTARGVHPLTEDRLQFDGPRATYGRFRVLHQIGAGSVGPVFRGEDEATAEAVVIKVVRVGLSPERATGVGAALAALAERLPLHPGLAGCLDAGVVDVEPYVVSRFVDGDSLDVALRGFGPARLVDALPRLRLLADGLDAAASVNLTHGSLHLRDIIVSVEHTVVTGVGIATVLERFGVRPPVRRPYCAPEVALGRGITPAADQYALAAIAHEWLTGRRVSGLESAVRIPGLTADAAEEIQAIFARALAEVPDERYPTATAFVEAVAAMAQDAAVQAPAKAARRSAAASAPRLTFDDLPDAVAPLPAAAADPLLTAPASDLEDVRLDDDALREFASDAAASDPASADLPDEAMLASPPPPPVPEPEPEPGPVLALDPDPQPEIVYQAWDVAPALPSDRPLVPEAFDPSPRPRSWRYWAIAIVAFTIVALAGGRLLLQWGTPSTREVVVVDAPAAEPLPGEPAGRAAEPPRGDPPTGSPPPTTSAPTSPPASPPAPLADQTTSPPAPAATAPERTPPRRTAPVTPPRTADKRADAPAPRRPAEPVPPLAGAARLLVRSSPAGAEVFVNGVRRGVTPLALRDLRFGTHTVRVTRAGFTPDEQRVSLEQGRPARAIDVALTRATGPPAPVPAAPGAATVVATGILVVDSRPAGARVLVDGVAVGVTPLTLSAVATGTRQVRLELAGYAPIATTVAVEPRERARVAVTLTPERP